MALLEESAAATFKRMAERAQRGSVDEALFSGLWRMALDVLTIEQKLTDIESDVSDVERAIENM